MKRSFLLIVLLSSLFQTKAMFGLLPVRAAVRLAQARTMSISIYQNDIIERLGALSWELARDCNSLAKSYNNSITELNALSERKKEKLKGDIHSATVLANINIKNAQREKALNDEYEREKKRLKKIFEEKSREILREAF